MNKIKERRGMRGEFKVFFLGDRRGDDFDDHEIGGDEDVERGGFNNPC